MYQIIYQSQSLVPFEMPELLALLIQSRNYNRAHYITGLLLYTPDGRFMQVLEGTREAVRHLYYKHIMVDPCHRDCHVLDEGPCTHRHFPNWSMGFRAAPADALRKVLGYVAPDNLALLVPRPPNGSELLALLHEFVAAGQATPLLEHPG